MSGSKPTSTLGPLLLARKGTAKPAMRGQLEKTLHSNVQNLDGSRPELPESMDSIADSQADLGWNDMGDEDENSAVAEPEVRRQQSDLVHRIADSNISTFKTAENQNQTEPRRSAASQGRRAAFTLRLDEERHLMLKLASTVHGESAQQLVTKALDSFLSEMPEIENLAAQVKRDGRKA